MSNVFNQFVRLFGRQGLFVGTVTAHNADGTSTLDDYHGREFIAQGQDVAVGNRAFVKDKRVQGQAPNLTETTVYV